MKTREQLIEEILEELICKHQNRSEIEQIIDFVVEACEEALPLREDLLMWDLSEGAILLRDKVLENLKKLKSK